jgi:xylose dehydrogenase (NAD/NADP)
MEGTVSKGTIRWGVISTAGIGEALIPGLLAADSCELVGIASRTAERAQAAAARWGCRGFPSYEALLAEASIDAVYIPLPNHLHAQWTIRALEAGKHVLCEKPLALSVAEVDRIAAATARTGRHVLEAFMYRHAPRWRRALELVSSGAIGEPHIVQIGFAFTVPSDPSNIRFIIDTGGGIVWDMGCYAANMARGILGAEPTEVFGFAESRVEMPVETTVSGVMRFPGEAAAPFWVSFDLPNPFAQVEVVGTEGWLALPGTGFRREPFTRLLLHRRGDEIYVGGTEPTVEEFAGIDPYRLEVEHLSDVIRGRTPLEYTLDDARLNTRVLETMHRSLKSGRPEPVAHAGPLNQ